MKKLDFGQALQLLGNAGVIIGILLLAYELNQNREMMEAQTRHELSSAIADQLLSVAANPELNNFIFRVNAGEPLTEEEQVRYVTFAFSRLRTWEDAHYQYRVGLYDEAEFAAQREGWRGFIQQSRGMREFWEQNRAAFSPEFAAEIDALISD